MVDEAAPTDRAEVFDGAAIGARLDQERRRDGRETGTEQGPGGPTAPEALSPKALN
jgi:hypothetical protein